MTVSVWNVEALTGYKPITTFWSDFSIADAFGVAAIKDTYNRAFKNWKSNYKYLTELVVVLNHKIWYYYQEGNEVYAKLYNDLWMKCDEWACEHLKGDEAAYYYRVLD